MLNNQKIIKLGLIILLVGVIFSCRKEEIEIIEAPQEVVIGADSAILSLLKNTTTNDGSSDNILDLASCFNIQLPVTVTANDIELVINNQDDLDIVEAIFDEFSNDVDTLVISFPITIILADYTQVVINDQAGLVAAASQCLGENEIDDDIECIDIQYPITAFVFNLNNELQETVIINNDEEFFNFLGDIDQSMIVTVDFPITVILWDGSVQQINNFNELESLILNAINACDEDDDNDPNDDDCDNCTTQELEGILTGCENWMVDKLERNDNDLEDNYIGYLFNFDAAGTVTVDFNATQFNGTWTSSGSGNGIMVTLNISGLPDFNDVWTLHEIQEQVNETKVDLRIGDDRLRFESDCSTGGGGVDDTVLVAALTSGDWYVNYYFDDTDETANYADYVFNYAMDHTATATDTNGTTNGSWSTSAGDETDLELNLNFGILPPLDELADDWDVLEVTNDIIRLKDISGGNGSIDFLTFGRIPYTGGGGSTDLETILQDGPWFVFSYVDSGEDQTNDYNGYNINFNTSNIVVASNGSNTNNGTWQVLSAGNELLLDFGTALPFEEFNDDDWDVLFVSPTRVELQDVSGGGSGTDNLILEKL